MEIRQLKYFVAIAKFGSFQSAANKLFVAQPALSRQIAELEREIQVKLFERQARGVALTAAGQTFLADVEKIFVDLEQAKRRVVQTAHGMLGSITVGLAGYFSWHKSVLGAISKFREEHDNIELTLTTAEISLEIQRQISRGLVDCGFTLYSFNEDDKLSRKKVLTSRFLLAVPAHWPVARAKRPRLTDVMTEPFVWFPREVAPAFYDRYLMMCNKAGFSPRIEQYAISEIGRLSMVATGAGCAIVTSAAMYHKPEQVMLLEMDELDLTVDLELVWRTDNHSPVLQQFVQSIVTEPEPRRTRKRT